MEDDAAPAPGRSPPDAVLFACTMNRVRSPMAAALMQRRFGDRVYVDSCGIREGEGIDPFVVAVMAEIGCDLSDQTAKTFDQLHDGSFDLIVALSPEAAARAGAGGPGPGGGDRDLAHRGPDPGRRRPGPAPGRLSPGAGPDPAGYRGEVWVMVATGLIWTFCVPTKT